MFESITRLRAAFIIVSLTVAASVAACTADPSADSGTVASLASAEGQRDAEAIRPFTIEIADEVLADLDTRLARTRLPDQIPGTGWDYGMNRSYLEELLAYWQDGFDWRAQERRLNEFDHFKTVIDEVDVHFIHQRSAEEGALPLLLTHGWPGSFVEFVDLIGPLTDPAAHGGDPADAFHVVIPSLPGYGFSGKPAETGYNPERMADVLAGLMERLGYDRYGAQGGDWGAIISRNLAGNYSDRLIGLHSNFMTGGPPPGSADPNEGVSAEESERRLERAQSFSDGRGYSAIQGTKPQTLGYGLNDSPAGLAAWIVEKFHGWSDNDGNIESAFTKDEMLTNVTLYWVTQTITSSSRLYYESGTHRRLVAWATSTCRQAWRFSRRRFFLPREGGPRHGTTSFDGPSCHAGATSLRWRSPSCWWTTSVRSSEG